MNKSVINPLRAGRPFQIRALLGFVVIIFLLGGGLAVDIVRLGAAANAEMDRLRNEEAATEAVERLRSSNFAVVSAVRAYFIAGDESFIKEMKRSDDEFAQLLGELRKEPMSGRGRQLLAGIEQTGAIHRQAVRNLVTKKASGVGDAEFARTFETEILPSFGNLVRALDEFTAYRKEQTRLAHEEAEQKLASSVANARLLALALVIIAVGFALYYSRLLARSYRDQQNALETARKAVSARDELLAVVAHDLRNPLAAINLKAGALKLMATSDEQREQANSISAIGARMEALIKMMLDVATIEAGRFSVRPAVCDVDSLLQVMHDLFAGQAQAKRISLERVVTQPGLKIRADWERLIQVLSNLIGNALKFTPEGGKVTLAVAPHADTVRFSIQDTGPGITPDALPHVFDRYWRTRTRGAEGSGLGLFIAKGIVEAHGGRIWAASEPGCCAKISFELPSEGGML